MVTKYQNPRYGRYLTEIQTVRLKQYDVEQGAYARFVDAAAGADIWRGTRRASGPSCPIIEPSDSGYCAKLAR